MAIYKGDKKVDSSAVEMPISTSIASNSTNNEVAGAKAVYDFADGYMTWGRFRSVISYDWALSVTHDYVKVPLEIDGQKSDIFSISNNEIVISKNISDLAVSLKIPVSTQGTSESRYILFERVRDGTAIGGGAMTETYCVANKTTTIYIPMTITNVQANDHIAVKIYGQSGDKIYRGNAQISLLGFNVNDTATTLTSLNTASPMNTGSLVGMGERTEVTDEVLEKTKLDEVADKDVGEQKVTPLETTETKTEGSGDTL